MTRDPELKFTPKGTALCKCGIAVNRQWTTEGGEKKSEVLFLDFAIWGKMAETFAQFTSKGAAVLLAGYLRLEQWENETDQTKHQKISLNVESFQFLDRKGDDDDSRPENKAAAAPAGCAGKR